jgi:enterobactin synthetase component D
MIRLTDNPFQFDPDCCQVSCFFDKDLYAAETAAQLNLNLPYKLDSAVPKRKAEFIAGRYCATQALEKLNAHSPLHVDIGENRSPVWPKGFVGSITHTHGYASAIAATQNKIRSIGIDSEQWISESIANNVAKQILTKDEIFDAHQHVFESHRHYLTFVFSAKESVFKCLYPLVNKFFGFHAAIITPTEHKLNGKHTGKFEFELLQELNEEFPLGFRGTGFYSLYDDLIHTAVILK